jgi:glutathione S-transferase
MAIVLFWGSGSPFSWRVLLALELKGLTYQSRVLQFSKGEHRSPEFLAINPRGQVPAMRDDGEAVYESLACLAYLDRKYPQPPLFGETPQEAGRIWRAVAEMVNYLDQPVEDIILPLYSGTAGTRVPEIRVLARKVGAELLRHERDLARGGPWLLSSRLPSAADCVLYPGIRSLMRAAEKPGAELFDLPIPGPTRLPAVAAWMKRVEALPNFDRTFPPHWRG